MNPRIAYVTFGHVDVTLPLINEYNISGIDCTLFLCFAQNKKRESIIDFSNFNVENGFVSMNQVNQIIPAVLWQYYAFLSRSKIFIFDNLKFLSWNNLILAKKLTSELKNFDVIHFSGDDGVIPWLVFFLKIRNKKIVFTIHDYKPHSGERVSLINKIIFALYLRVGSFIVFQNSNDFKDVVSNNKRIANKIYFIPFGVLEFYKCFLDKNNEFNFESDFLFFGRISQYKGIEYLVQAFEKINKLYPYVRLIIAGSGDLGKTMHKVNSNKNIILLNRYLNNSELSNLLTNTKVVICPYIDATQSGVAMTAFAFNKPVIASDVGGFNDIITEGETGFLVPPKDIKSLTNAILKVLDNPDLLDFMDKNIDLFRRYGTFKWENISIAYNSLYLKLDK